MSSDTIEDRTPYRFRVGDTVVTPRGDLYRIVSAGPRMVSACSIRYPDNRAIRQPQGTGYFTLATATATSE